MIKQPSRITTNSSQSLLAIIWIAVAIAMSCARSTNKSRPQLRERPQEKPVPFIPTTENEGKRCVAHDYFGLHRHDMYGGYTEFCHKLQLRLITAAREGNPSEIRETLKFGANPNLPIDDSYPPLQTAAASGHADAVRLLLDNGAEVNRVTSLNTPLNAAASYGHLEVIQVLLERGADVCIGFPGGAAGDIAQSNGHMEIAKLLKSAETVKCK